ncbi:MAG: holo-[acyl-carrier-protein] synthase [Dehalococcoidia bacterium]|nr:holo-[acyl-carrier-protein] synthase [Dehalococcoidia bacterium]
MINVGIDIIEIERIQNVKIRYPKRFLKKIFTQNEINYCRDRSPQLAARFAAKEAMMKALGTGIRGVGWKDVEVIRNRGQAPQIKLSGRGKKVGESIGLKNTSLSISHSKDYAVACVTIETSK